MLRYRTLRDPFKGVLAAGLGLLMAGCFSDPDLNTGLTPEGAPRVLAMMAWDTATRSERAAFCRYEGGVLDPKAPSLVQGSIKCPDKESDFVAAQLEPLSWNVRAVFDELLNGDKVEKLTYNEATDIYTGHIDETLPFDISCGGMTIGYDGYYYPNGNKESNPVGPALVAQPADLAPTDSDCQVTIKPSVVVDKQGEPVPSGTNENVFTIHVKQLDVVETDPVDADAVADRAELDPDGAVAFLFNSLVDDTSIAASEIEIRNLDTNAVVPSDFAVGDNELDIFGVASLPPGNYAASIKATASIADIVGGTRTFADDVTVRFVVPMP